MLYCGITNDSQQIGAAISGDLYHWKKYEDNPVIHPNSSWSNWQPHGYHSCRDPHILEIEPGQFSCYYTANTQDSDVCCIAACRSDDLLHWHDYGPVYKSGVNKRGPGQIRMESPGVNVIPASNGKTGAVAQRYLLHFTHRWGVGIVTSLNPLPFAGAPTRLGTYHACEIFQDPESK